LGRKQSRNQFAEAAKVFDDPWAIESFDEAHSDLHEKRFTTIGLVENHLLRVTFTVRIDENADEIVKIISAREAKGQDKERYERIRAELDRF
jgi:uncharacterized protein